MADPPPGESSNKMTKKKSGKTKSQSSAPSQTNVPETETYVGIQQTEQSIVKSRKLTQPAIAEVNSALKPGPTLQTTLDENLNQNKKKQKNKGKDIIAGLQAQEAQQSEPSGIVPEVASPALLLPPLAAPLIPGPTLQTTLDENPNQNKKKQKNKGKDIKAGLQAQEAQQSEPSGIVPEVASPALLLPPLAEPLIPGPTLQTTLDENLNQNKKKQKNKGKDIKAGSQAQEAQQSEPSGTAPEVASPVIQLPLPTEPLKPGPTSQTTLDETPNQNKKKQKNKGKDIKAGSQAQEAQQSEPSGTGLEVASPVIQLPLPTEPLKPGPTSQTTLDENPNQNKKKQKNKGKDIKAGLQAQEAQQSEPSGIVPEVASPALLLPPLAEPLIPGPTLQTTLDENPNQNKKKQKNKGKDIKAGLQAQEAQQSKSPGTAPEVASPVIQLPPHAEHLKPGPTLQTTLDENLNQNKKKQKNKGKDIIAGLQAQEAQQSEPSGTAPEVASPVIQLPPHAEPLKPGPTLQTTLDENLNQNKKKQKNKGKDILAGLQAQEAQQSEPSGTAPEVASSVVQLPLPTEPLKPGPTFQTMLDENPNQNKKKQKNKGKEIKPSLQAQNAQQLEPFGKGPEISSPVVKLPPFAEPLKPDPTLQTTLDENPNQDKKKQKNQGNIATSTPQQIEKQKLAQDIQSKFVSVSPVDGPVQIISPKGSTKEMSGFTVPKRIPQSDAKKRGERTIIETNHLEIKLNKKDAVIHYDVEILPDKPKKMFVVVINYFLQKYFPGRNPAFDGIRNLYSSGPLFNENEINGSVEITEEDRDKPTQYGVKIKYAARIDLSGLYQYTKTGSSADLPQSSIQCLDVVLRHSAHQKFVKVGSSFFSPPAGQVYSLGGGLDLWYGHFQSAVLGWKPFLNVDVAHKGFTKQQNVIGLIEELDNPRSPCTKTGKPMDMYTLLAFKKYIKNLKIEYQIPKQASSKRIYRVVDVLDSPDRLTFNCEGKKMTVLDYFKKDRNYIIKYPGLPCLSVSKQKTIYYPAELCTVLGGQIVIAKMDGQQTTNLIRVAATPAYDRKKKIYEIIQKGNYKQDKVAKEFGISVSENFEKINARILIPPKLEYNQNQIITPNNGVWNPDRFFVPANLTNWGIIILDDRVDQRAVQSLVRTLQMSGKKLGMNIQQPIFIACVQLRELSSQLLAAFKDKLQLVMVVVNAAKNDYAQVKKTAELQHGVLTQCIQGKTVQSMNASTATMLLQKINSKLDSINHKLAIVSRPPCLNVPCMIVGADVTHPSPGQDDIPSIAAVAASHDPTAYKYNVTLRIQAAKTEIITDLSSMIKEQLIYFYQHTKQKPQKIIMFRDGVSDGQFQQVLNAELNAIRSACRALQADYTPKISIFIVQKRHHTRFFPTDPKFTDRKGNASAGTCIDSVITHPTELDFYLLSHASIQGTARPTKYHCIWDDSEMQEDEVEHLAYYLCHLYSRCTRSVSYPAPTYYAHLAAARARVLTENVRFNMNNLSNEQDKLAICSNIKIANPMFFV